MRAKKEKYSLKTVQQVYSYWGKSMLAYRMGVSLFGLGGLARNKVVDSLHLKKGDVVLDLACGPGIMFSRIEKRIGLKGTLIGVDYVPEMISQCEKLVRRKKWLNVKLIRKDAAKLKLAPGTVDKIVSVIGLSAIPDHKGALRACYAALKKGGTLVVLDGKPFSQRYRLLNPILRLIRWSKSYEREKDLLKDLKEIFGDVKVKEYLLGSTFIALASKNRNIYIRPDAGLNKSFSRGGF